VSDLLEAVVLGIVQGLTEFLPVSSTGHLILMERFLGISEEEFGLQFDAAIHLGTLAAVLVFFRHTAIALARAWWDSIIARDWRKSLHSRLAWLLLVGTLPAAVIGAAIENTAESTFRSPELVAVMLVVFCLPLLLAERLGAQTRGLHDAGIGDALLVGVAQSIALVPGVSRSGITISAGMLAGLRREEAAVFAFLLSAPIIAGAGGKQLFDALSGSSGSEAGLHVYAAGMLAAAGVGYAAIAFLLRYLRGNPLHAFIAYRVALAAIVFGLAAAGVL